jgi:outer membrane protein OmpA-like peptidoglycan-associated protein
VTNPGDRWRRSWIVAALALLALVGLGVALVAGGSDNQTDGSSVSSSTAAVPAADSGEPTIEPAPEPTAPESSEAVPSIAALVDPVFGFEASGDQRVILGGVVPSEAERLTLIDATKASFPGLIVVDTGISVNPDAPAFDSATLVDALSLVEQPASFVYTGGNYRLRGFVANEAAKASVEAALRSALGEITVPISNELEIRTAPAPESSSVPASSSIPIASTIPAEPTEVTAEEAAIVEEINQAIALEGITFATSSARLTGKSTATLDRVAASLSESPNLSVKIEGHTDNIGLPASNLTLSQQRADAVKTYLVTKGISADRLTATGFGQERPVAENTTSTGRAQNRRIDFVAA